MNIIQLLTKRSGFQRFLLSFVIGLWAFIVVPSLSWTSIPVVALCTIGIVELIHWFCMRYAQHMTQGSWLTIDIIVPHWLADSMVAVTGEGVEGDEEEEEDGEDLQDFDPKKQD